jgi:serine protease Do
MTRRFTLLTVALTAVVGLLIGVILAGGVNRSSVRAGDTDALRVAAAHPAGRTPAPGSLVNFADVVERINPAVVNVVATLRSPMAPRSRGRQSTPPIPGAPDSFGDGPGNSRGDGTRRGSGSGFIIDPDGTILTNHHVVENAERLLVKLSDGRTLHARVIGTDPDTDIALIKIDSARPLPVAPLGDSSTLRMGEWVCAIGNPLGYEHTVTVGVVSYLGRKLFDASLDDYIQTDAAISFGNSGGPLINAYGEVIGINTAISSRGSNIGFAVPINGATAILPQLRERGRVVRGYLGLSLRGISADLQRSLDLASSSGALVQDVREGSPADRAGLRPYDVVTGFDGRDIPDDNALIRAISGRAPGTQARVRVWRDGRQQTVTVKLAERPPSSPDPRPDASPSAAPDPNPDLSLGLTVRDLDATAFNRLNLPSRTRGVLITSVSAMSASFDAEIQRNSVILEIDRQPIRSVADYRRVAARVRPGDVLTFYLYEPLPIDSRKLVTVRIDDR